jgi:hypothetical protein
MAWYDHWNIIPGGVAASAINAYLPVKQNPGVDSGFVAAASVNDDVVGMTIATVPTWGGDLAVVFQGVAKAIAGASLGAGARVGVGSSNGVLVPIPASGVASGGAAVNLRFSIGRAQTGATVAGQVFSVLLQPEQIV